MDGLKKAYYRTYQQVFDIGMRCLHWRKPIAIRQRGLTVPDDIAVVGFDDHPIAERCNPPLTTVQQPLREEGSTAADLAMRMIDGEAATTVIKHMTLVRRKSL